MAPICLLRTVFDQKFDLNHHKKHLIISPQALLVKIWDLKKELSVKGSGKMKAPDKLLVKSRGKMKAPDKLSVKKQW